MPLVTDNLRLAELVAIVRQNQAFFDSFTNFLGEHGYPTIKDFIEEHDDNRAIATIESYLLTAHDEVLYDGIGRPYAKDVGNWYFLAWLLRDAPAQRLGPLLKSIEGGSLSERKAKLLNSIRKFVGPLFPEAEKWEWPTISELMLARLEGSRRALKGTTFENTVRTVLRAVIAEKKLSLRVGDGQVRIHDETYDVQIIGTSQTVLVPVKTRETMGGGHANLFTRDIHKAISVAHENGYECIPVVIAESWGGDLNSLQCEHFIYLPLNPNQTDEVAVMLHKAVLNISDYLGTIN
jgi:hypothetical protein